jgi:DNA-binding NarL/FixJ family response regulator
MRALNRLDQPLRRVLIIDHDLAFGPAVRLFLDFQPNLDVVAWLPDSETGLRYAMDLRPDVLVFGWNWDLLDSMRLLRRLDDPDYKPLIIVFADDGDLSAFVAAKRCGAHSVHYRCNMQRVLSSTIRHLGTSPKHGVRHVEDIGAQREYASA